MKTKSLPKLICKHPYFHEGLNEEKAKTFLSTTSEGSFLFCQDNKQDSNEYYLVCKGMINDVPTLKTIKCTYIEERFGTSVAYGGLESVLPGLEAIVRYVEKFKSPFSFLCTPFKFIPSPIYNSTVENNRSMIQSHTTFAPLEKDTAKIIFQNLDLGALLASSSVSKSWYTFFNRNFISTLIIQREDIEQKKIRQVEIQRDSDNAQYLLDRYKGTGLE